MLESVRQLSNPAPKNRPTTSYFRKTVDDTGSIPEIIAASESESESESKLVSEKEQIEVSSIAESKIPSVVNIDSEKSVVESVSQEKEEENVSGIESQEEKSVAETEKEEISSVESVSVQVQDKEDIETSQTDMKYEIPSVASSDKDISISEEEKEDIDEESSSEEESRIDQEKVMKAREKAEKLLKTIDEKIPILNSVSKAERRKEKLKTAFQAIARGEEINIEKVLHQAEKNAQRDAIFAATDRGERLDMTKLPSDGIRCVTC